MKTNNGKARLIAALVIVSVIGIISCKKNDSVTSTLQAPVCEPVRFTSTGVNGTYIVMLGNGSTTSRAIQPADQVRAVTNDLFRKHSIETTQLDDVLNSIGTGFVARLSQQQADELSTDSQVQLVERDRVIILDNGCFSVVAPSTAQWGIRMIGAGDGIGKRV
jgi:hypothetical protein